MENTVSKENRLGTMPIKRLVISMALPIMVSMLVQAVYGILDGIFVSYISIEAFTAVSLATPLQSFMIALSVGTAVGVNALLSRRLGEKRFEDANRVANNGLFLALLSSMIFTTIGILFSRAYFEMQTDNKEIIELGTVYLELCSIGSFGTFCQVMVERLLQATGKPRLSMITQITGSVIDAILDPLLIFGIWIFPNMGIAGAAVSTMIGQGAAIALGLYFNIAKNNDIKLKFEWLIPNWRVITRIYYYGFPSIIAQSIFSVMVYVVNAVLLGFSDLAVAVFGIYFNLQGMIFMPVFGLINGMLAILSYNYGAGNRKRVVDTFKFGATCAISIMAVGALLFELIPALIISIYDSDAAVLAIGIPAMRIISLGFIFAGFTFVCGTTFQALGNSKYSMITSLTRQVIFLIPAVYLMSLTRDLNAVWAAFPIAEVLSAALAGFLLLRYYKKTFV